MQNKIFTMLLLALAITTCGITFSAQEKKEQSIRMVRSIGQLNSKTRLAKPARAAQPNQLVQKNYDNDESIADNANVVRLYVTLTPNEKRGSTSLLCKKLSEAASVIEDTPGKINEAKKMSINLSDFFYDSADFKTLISVSAANTKEAAIGRFGAQINPKQKHAQLCIDIKKTENATESEWRLLAHQLIELPGIANRPQQEFEKENVMSIIAKLFQHVAEQKIDFQTVVSKYKPVKNKNQQASAQTK